MEQQVEMGNDLYWWKCSDGHESVHSEKTIEDLNTHPRCPIQLRNGKLCWKLLVDRIRKMEVMT